MPLLDSISTPADVRKIPANGLAELAREIRAEIIADVAAHGGHLAASLGAVELCIALLRTFNPPRDKIVFDVGHQSYAWKILTGRRAAMAAALRSAGGPGGFPNPAESPYDAFVAGHAGAALAAAEGFAAAFEAANPSVRPNDPEAPCAVAVVGDASLANGGTLEALNNASVLARKTILVLNDNKMSIGRNTGAIARFLGRLLSAPRYNRMKRAAERTGHKLRLTFLRRFYHGLERRVKSLWLGNMFFERLGFRYIGPIDGHDASAVENALSAARLDKRSCVVHVVTEKGRGFAPAEKNPEAWHGVGPFDPSSGIPPPPKRDWSAAFGDAICEIAAADPCVAAMTAAMRCGTGLSRFAREFPARFYDLGIAEGSMVTFAGGLAAGGMKPVVCIYSTFLQRSVDHVFHDVCLSSLPVVFAIDRAGAVGADGRTHQGVFDIPMLRALPGLSILQPRSAEEMRAMLEAALERSAPVAIRWPRGCPPEKAAPPAPVQWGRAEVMRTPQNRPAVWIWALGDMVPSALAVAERLESLGAPCGVVNARFVKPLDAGLLRSQAAAGAAIATLENGALAGGFGSAVKEALGPLSGNTVSFGWPDEYLPHATVQELRAKYGLSDEAVFSGIVEFLKERRK